MPKLTKIELLAEHLIKIISETNGISLADTLELAVMGDMDHPQIKKPLQEFRRLLFGFQSDEVDIKTLLAHPVADALFIFFSKFPKPYIEEHIHLTGSLSAEFIHPHLMKVLTSEKRQIYIDIIDKVYGAGTAEKIQTIEDVDNLVRLKDDEFFERYLKILLLPKLILVDRQTHSLAAYHMAHELYHKYNVGKIRLKFTLSRANQTADEQIPGLELLKEEDVVLGLYDGFMQFKAECPNFDFVLSPCFRKEADFFDPAFFPGTGTPEAGGEDFHGFMRILKILNKKNFVGADVVELAPMLDPTNNSACFASKVTREIVLAMNHL
jgi:hypothetical protein